MSAGLLLGLQQYTHSASCCLLGPDGEPLFAASKERLTRKKFDGGDTASLVEYALRAIGRRRADIARVVANNHLFRIRPFEETLPWAVALNQQRPSFLDPFNLLPGVPKHELSHHLAHAWSVLPAAPFDEGLIVVMDGIGNTLRDVRTTGSGRTTDEDLPRARGFSQAPEHPDPKWGWREAESVYAFRGLELQRLFKRWTRERTPDFLYNYGFENMESLGAVYSRVSSHIFGDWNACGKVMGLAPWNAVWNGELPKAGDWILRGPLERLKIHWKRLQEEPHPNAWTTTRHRRAYARLAADVQAGLEKVVLPFLRRLRRKTGARNLCFTGGVALNCALNGRIQRECGFEQVFIPSYPGDEGVAVGCAFFGLHAQGERRSRAPRRRPLSPFLGRSFRDKEIEAALAEFAPFCRSERSRDLLAETAQALAAFQVVGWFQGCSEFGPRALGNRSILAHPGRKSMVRRINASIKKREAFRPFAPAVLARSAAEWFENPGESPFMSAAALVRPQRRRRIPAVVHADGTARIQTLRQEDNPLFFALIEEFEKLTGLPLLLNTSFNVRGEPLVEAPCDALRSFLDSDLDVLVLGDRMVRKTPFPALENFSEVRPCQNDPDSRAEVVSDARGEPIQVRFLSRGRTFDSDTLELGLFEACTGETTLKKLIEEFQEEFGLAGKEILGRLQRLFRKRLIRFAPQARALPSRGGRLSP